MNMQPKGLEPGIYFGLDENIYHNDPAFNHSGMVDMLIHPKRYHVRSPLNKDRKQRKASDSMIFGKRCHALLLTPDEFFKAYAVAGGKFIANDKRTYIGAKDWEKIRDSVQVLKDDPSVMAYFAHGYPEVTIVWPDTEVFIDVKDPSGFVQSVPIMQRIRVDWLRTFGGIDYKKCRSIENGQIGFHISDFGYDIQDSLYIEGIRQIKRLLAEGKAKAYGDVNEAWLEAFIADPDSIFQFVFQMSDEPYLYRVINFDDDIRQIASDDIFKAKMKYKYHIENYGPDNWPSGKGQIDTFSINHLPRRYLDRGA